MSYVDDVIADLELKNDNQYEFLQAAKEVLNSLRVIVDRDSYYEKMSVKERIISWEMV